MKQFSVNNEKELGNAINKLNGSKSTTTTVCLTYLGLIAGYLAVIADIMADEHNAKVEQENK